VLLLVLTHRGDAEEADVPAAVQVALVAKLATYQLRAALAEADRIGGLPHDEQVVEYSDASALAAACREKRVSILYLTPGMSGEVEAIGRGVGSDAGDDHPESSLLAVDGESNS
jgi:hypothetical protein